MLTGRLNMSPKTLAKKLQKSVDNIYSNKFYTTISSNVQILLADHIARMVQQTNVWNDFESHGYLWQRLGGGDLSERLMGIIIHWISHIEVAVIDDGLSFRAIKADYSDVIKLDDAMFESITTRPGPYKGQKHKIEWLRWLLLEGREYVVEHYIFTERLSSDASRGGGLMIPSKQAPGWRVPKGYSGTINDNFITRTVNEHLSTVARDILNAIKGQL